jgi:hypothetical protein
MKRKWQKALKWISKVAPLSLLLLMIAGMTGCLGGGGLLGCGSCSLPFVGGGSDWTGVFGFILILFLLWTLWQRFKKK